ncbi:integrase [Bradyrhizobium sp. i1.15.2]
MTRTLEVVPRQRKVIETVREKFSWMGLERDDVDLDAGVLTVRLTKFGKSRLVPLHPTTRTALRDYAHRRDAMLGSRCGSTFFVAEQGGRSLHQYVHRVFWRLSREIGLPR